MSSSPTDLREELDRAGFAIRRGVSSLEEYRRLAAAVGVVVAEERIQLRPGAHAYVAKPGPVPLHTDHPQVEIVAWLCVQQDELHGATRLLDSFPVLASYSAEERAFFEAVSVLCPPLAGGPPRHRFPVLRRARAGIGHDLLFCSPWLDAVGEIPAHQKALDDLRGRLDRAAATEAITLRLRPGEALFVDNQRILHGRRRISAQSQRQLHRLWLITHGTAANE